MPLFIPIAIAGVAAYSYLQSKKNESKPLEEKHAAVYAQAVSVLPNKETLVPLAKAFEAKGYKQEANILKNRATLPNISKKRQEAYDDVYEQAINSIDAEAIDDVADAFIERGAVERGMALKEQAKIVDVATKVVEGDIVKNEEKAKPETLASLEKTVVLSTPTAEKIALAIDKGVITSAQAQSAIAIATTASSIAPAISNDSLKIAKAIDSGVITRSQGMQTMSLVNAKPLQVRSVRKPRKLPSKNESKKREPVVRWSKR
jgi:hypothetical protein